MITLLTSLADRRTPWADVRARLTTVLGGAGAADPRVRAALDRPHAQSDGRLDLGDLAAAAALDAGFSSSAHFSAAFREMFGLEPSRLAKGRLVMP